MTPATSETTDDAGRHGSPRSPFRPPDALAPLLLSRAHFSAHSREGWQRAKNYYEALVNLSVFVVVGVCSSRMDRLPY